MKRILVTLLILGFGAVANSQTPTMVQDLNTGPIGSIPYQPIVYKNKLYFFADTFNGVTVKDWLWSYDELTPFSIVPSAVNYIHNRGTDPVIWNNKLYISFDNNPATTPAIVPPAIFAYDGVNPMTIAVGAPADTFIGSMPAELTVAGGKLYFIASKELAKSDLWCYSGTGSPVKIDIAPASRQGATPSWLTEYNGKLYFGANTTGLSTEKLQVLDPATNNFSIVTSTAYPNGVHGGGGLLSAQGKLYFVTSSDTAGRELYSYNGSVIKRISNIAVGGVSKQGAQSPLCLYGEDIYFQGSTDGINFQLYKCSTATDAVSLAAIIDSVGSADIYDMIVYKNKLYFNANLPATGNELWRYDGQKASMVADLNIGTGHGVFISGTSNSNNKVFAVYNNHLYFTGNDGTHGPELFRLNDPTGVIENVSWKGSSTVYPNPATSSATIAITVEREQSLRIAVSDMQGREIWTSEMAAFKAGKSEVIIPMKNTAPGQYFYRLTSKEGALLTSGSLIKQ